MKTSREKELFSIVSDTRYVNQTADELKVLRANMINTGTATKYDLACVQYWIMEKEDRSILNYSPE
jgi:hypothetical protein